MVDTQSHIRMAALTQQCLPATKPSPEEMFPIYQELLPRPRVKALVKGAGVKLYWRLLTPLVVMWLMIYQRLNSDRTCDEVVSHLHSGAMDAFDLAAEPREPISKRLTSESSSAYVQGRNRLPLSVLIGALHHVATAIDGWLRPGGVPQAHWKGHSVRLLDGTTHRLKPVGDLVETYGQAKNQHGNSYWVIAKSVVAFNLFSQAVIAHAEGPGEKRETSFVRLVMAADSVPDSLYLADRGFGIYVVAQVAEYGKKRWCSV